MAAQRELRAARSRGTLDGVTGTAGLRFSLGQSSGSANVRSGSGSGRRAPSPRPRSQSVA